MRVEARLKDVVRDVEFGVDIITLKMDTSWRELLTRSAVKNLGE